MEKVKPEPLAADLKWVAELIAEPVLELFSIGIIQFSEEGVSGRTTEEARAHFRTSYQFLRGDEAASLREDSPEIKRIWSITSPKVADIALVHHS